MYVYIYIYIYIYVTPGPGRSGESARRPEELDGAHFRLLSLTEADFWISGFRTSGFLDFGFLDFWISTQV